MIGILKKFKQTWGGELRPPLFFALIVLSGFWGIPSLAIEEEIVTSNHHSGSAFKAVTGASVDSPDFKKTGFYARTARGNWEKVVTGNISLTQTGPLLSELEITRFSRRFESIAVVDGRLVIFNINSRENNPDSIVFVGEGDFQVIDPMTNLAIPLPKIDNIQGIEVLTLDISISQSHQIVLVSIRNPHVNSENAGYTIGFLVPLEETSSANMSLVTNPLLLDNEFRTSRELRSLVAVGPSGESIGVVSKNLLSFLAREMSSDSNALKKWKANLLASIRGNTAIEGLPYINLENFELITPNPPNVEFAGSKTRDLVISQEYSFNEIDKVKINYSARKFHVLGRIQLDSLGEPIIHKVEVSTGLTSSTFFAYFVENNLYINGSTPVTEPIKLASFDLGPPKEFSFAVVQPKEDSSYLYVVYSYKDDKGDELTSFAKIKIQEQNYHVEVKSAITNKFYEGEELSQRIKTLNEDGGLVLFDYKTASQPSQAAYEQAYRANALHFDLKQSSSQKIAKRFISPNYEISLGSQKILYREYEVDKEEIKESKTGLYLFNKDKSESSFFPGQLIKDSENKEPIWSEVTVKIDSEGELAIRAVSLDSSFENGNTAMSLNLIVTKKNSLSDLTPARIALPHIFNTSYLKFVKIIPSLKGGKQFSVVSGLEKDGRMMLMVYTVLIVDEKDEKGSFYLDTAGAPYLIQDDESYSAQEVVDRIMYDEQGQAYWVVDPELDIDDSKFILMDLDTQNTHKINADDRDSKKSYQSYYDALNEFLGEKKTTTSETLAWKVKKKWLKDSPSLKQLIEKGSSNIRTDLFPQLLEIMNRLADRSQEPTHQVLIVPNDLKQHVYQMALSRFVNSSGPGEFWSKRNKDIELFIFGETASNSQSQLIQQLQVHSEVNRDQRGLLLVDGAKVINLGRPKPSATESAFQIPDLMANDTEHFDSASDDRKTILDDNSVSQTFPHAIYLLATEGRRVEPHKIQREGRNSVRPRYSSLIVVSEKEWNQITKEKARLEATYGLENMFDVEHLSAPNREEQIRLFEEILDSSDVSVLDYKYVAEKIAHDHEGLSQKEAKNKVISYLVTQTDTLANDQKMNPLMAFSDVLLAFRRMVLYDELVRKRRVIDHRVVQLALARVFKMPLKISLLDDTDPLKILSRPDILSLIQTHGGYPGDFNVTKQVVDTILGLTRQETSKSMPGSIVTFGDTSTGKTQLFKSIVKVIDIYSGGNFKAYDFKRDPLSDYNMNSRVFILPVSKLTESDETSGLINVDIALEHLEHFLASPNGFRGWILVDDLHYCSPEVKTKIISRLRTLFDSEDEMVHVKSPFEDSFVSFPVRNLVHFLNFNPTSDQERLKRYIKAFDTSPDPKLVAVASLKEDGVQVDESFFNRYSLFLNMDKFPITAKGPGLIERVKAQLIDFYGDGHFVAISPGLVKTVVTNFSEVDARNFISGAINGIGKHVSDKISGQENSFSIVVPSTNRIYDENSEFGTPGPNKASDTKSDLKSETPIIRYIEENSVVLTIDENFEGKLHFLNLIIDSFREQVLEGFVQAVRSDTRYSGDELRRSHLKSYFEQATLDHLRQNDDLPLSAISLDPGKFGLSGRLHFDVFKQVVADISQTNTEYFPQLFDHEGRQRGRSLERLISSDSLAEEVTTRGMVNTNYVSRTRIALHDYLRDVLKIDSLSELPKGADWLKGLQEEFNLEAQTGDKRASKRMSAVDLGRRLADLMSEYMPEMQAKYLLEKSGNEREQYAKMFEYDNFRMYLYVIDKAIALLPWEDVLTFIIRGIRSATHSMDLGGMSGVQEFIFGRESILRPTTGDHLMQILENSKERQALDVESIKRISQHFSNNCERMLAVGSRARLRPEGN